MEVLLPLLVLVVVVVVLELMEVMEVMEVVEVVEVALQRWVAGLLVVEVVVVDVAAAAGAGEVQQGNHEGGISLEVEEATGASLSLPGEFPGNPQSFEVGTNHSGSEQIAGS